MCVSVYVCLYHQCVCDQCMCVCVISVCVCAVGGLPRDDDAFAQLHVPKTRRRGAHVPEESVGEYVRVGHRRAQEKRR
jgi:hypothetical protein